MNKFELRKLQKMLNFLVEKMEHDKSQHLTHRQRNSNDEWNIAYLLHIENMVDKSIYGDDNPKNKIPF